MRDPYLYSDVDVLRNLAGIKDTDTLRKAEADITNLAMTGIYNMKFDSFGTAALQEVHRMIFGQIYDWAGEFRTIQMIKSEDVLGGDTVRYAFPKEIKRQLSTVMKDLSKLRRNGENDRDVVFRLVRIIAQIWQIHPFREGNTLSVIVFAVLFANAMGFDVDHELFKAFFFDAILHDTAEGEQNTSGGEKGYEKIGDYHVKDYKERPHQYWEDSK